MEQRGIRIVAIAGSVRPKNFTARSLALVSDEIRKHPDIRLTVIEPASLSLPLPGAGGGAALDDFRSEVAQATGVILATPEYHGSFSSVIKLVIENLGFPSVLKGKPVALLGVAAGEIGAIKALEHLGSVCSHIGALVLPGRVSVARVQKLFDDEGRILDEAIGARIRGVATTLIDYIRGSICPAIAMEEMVRLGKAASPLPQASEPRP